MNEETPHELVISGPGGLTQEEALNHIARQFPLEKRGQHVWFEVPTSKGLDPVHAFLKQQGLKLLDVEQVGARYRVKCVDTP